MAEPNAEKAPENSGQDTVKSRPKRVRRWTPSKNAAKAEAAPETPVETPAEPAPKIEYQASSAAAALIARAAQLSPAAPKAEPELDSDVQTKPSPAEPTGEVDPAEPLASDEASDNEAITDTIEDGEPDELIDASQDQHTDNQEEEPIGVVEVDDTSPDDPHEDATLENDAAISADDTADLDISSDEKTDDTPETTSTPARSNTLAARRFKRWTPVKYQTKDDIQVETMADENPPVAETGAPSKPKRTFKHWKPAKLHDEAENAEAEPVEIPSTEAETAQPRNFKHWKPAALRAEDSAAGDEQDMTASKPVEPELKPSPRQFKHWKPAALVEEAASSQTPQPEPEPAKPAQPKQFKHWKPAAQRAEEEAAAQQRAEQEATQQAARKRAAAKATAKAEKAKAEAEQAAKKAAADQPKASAKPTPKVTTSTRVNGARTITNDLEALPGIGSALIEMLNRAGIDSLETLAEAEAEALRPQLGPVGELINLKGWIEFANARKSA